MHERCENKPPASLEVSERPSASNGIEQPVIASDSEATETEATPRNYRVGRFPPPLVMPGLEPGIQVAPSVIIRGRWPWMHGSRPVHDED